MTVLSMYRGDTRRLQHTITRGGVVVNLTGAAVFFTAKRNLAESYASAPIKKGTNATGGTIITNAAGGIATSLILPTDTTGFTARTILEYDVEVYLPNGDNFTSERGQLVVEPDISQASYITQTPLTIMTIDLLAWWRADIGLTLNGSTVSAWADQSGNGFHLTQATATAQPTLSLTGGPNSRPSLIFDGTTDYLANTILDRPAPAIEPTYVWLIGRQVTWTGTDRVFAFGTDSTAMSLFQGGGSPNLLQNTGSNTHGGWTLNTFMRLESYFSGSVSDFTRAGSAAPSTGLNAGNSDPAAGFQLAAAAGSLFGNVEICEAFVAKALPGATRDAQLNAYVLALYGAGLV